MDVTPKRRQLFCWTIKILIISFFGGDCGSIASSSTSRGIYKDFLFVSSIKNEAVIYYFSRFVKNKSA